MDRVDIIKAVAAATLVATSALHAQAQVKAPPLPAGSEMAQVQGGMNPEEIKREKRAHHHKGHVKKDVTRDDSDNGNGKDKDKGNKK
jgi:hypothetical protein